MATELKYEASILHGKIMRLNQERDMTKEEVMSAVHDLQEHLDHALRYGKHPENIEVSMDWVRMAMNRLTKLRGYVE